jgi:TPR repeat protein
MNGQIFISYRREDASYPAGRLCDNLHTRFPQNEIFMDVDSIKPGVDFIKTIEDRVGACDVLVAVIGKRWLSAADQEGRRRLDNPEDFVRAEVGTALKRGVRVIPVLVEGAVMPPADQLPEELKPLARRNALSLSHDGFRADSERLMDSVGEVLAAAREERPPRPPEGQPPRRGRAPGPDQTESLPGLGAGPSARAPDRTSLKGVTANLQRPRRWLVVLGLGVVVCLLGVGLFKATRPPWVSIGGQVSGADDWFVAAKHYLDVKDYAKALPLLQNAAEAGNAEAMNKLGVLYGKGHGVVQDYAQAREWYQKAAKAGEAWGMNNLGWLYENGLSVARDYAKAREWYQKAADAGNTDAMASLGLLYDRGQGGAQDYAKAREWYQKAADAGNPTAMAGLGWLYDTGQGGAQDYTKAREWYQKAADKGSNAIVMRNLGVLYRDGKGGTQDYAKAREWFQKAADKGNAYAKQALLQQPSK